VAGCLLCVPRPASQLASYYGQLWLSNGWLAGCLQASKQGAQPAIHSQAASNLAKYASLKLPSSDRPGSVGLLWLSGWLSFWLAD